MRLARAMRASRGSPGRGPGAACAAKGETRRPGEGPAPAKASPHPRTHRLGRADRGERRRLGDSDLRVSLASLDAQQRSLIDAGVNRALMELAQCHSMNIVFKNNKFVRNSATAEGGAIFMEQLTNCDVRFQENEFK